MGAHTTCVKLTIFRLLAHTDIHTIINYQSIIYNVVIVQYDDTRYKRVYWQQHTLFPCGFRSIKFFFLSQ